MSRTKLEVLAVVLQHEGMSGQDMMDNGFLAKEDASTLVNLFGDGKIRWDDQQHGWFVVDHMIP